PMILAKSKRKRRPDRGRRLQPTRARRRSAPAAFDVDPGAAVVLPAALFPVLRGALALPVAVDPLVGAVRPAPVTARPDEAGLLPRVLCLRRRRCRLRADRDADADATRSRHRRRRGCRRRRRRRARAPRAFDPEPLTTAVFPAAFVPRLIRA